jgi:hypothetical protein
MTENRWKSIGKSLVLRRYFTLAPCLNSSHMVTTYKDGGKSMKTISQNEAYQIKNLDWTQGLQQIDQVTRLCRYGGELAEDICATVAGIFCMRNFRPPLRNLYYDDPAPLKIHNAPCH